MTLKDAIAAAAAGLLAAALASSAVAQVGPTPDSVIPNGLKAGTGAPFPKGHYKSLDKLPDWGGVWQFTFPRTAAGAPRPVIDPVPLKGKYKAEYEAWRAEVKANNGVVKTTATSYCSPPGMPRIMGLPQYPYEFLFTPGRVTINQEAWMQTRHIWTDGRPHAEDPEPGYFGDSVGHWEGDTLVADTIGIKDTVPLGAGMSHSDKLHFVERIHLKKGDPDTLIDEITVDDSEALEHPFTTVSTFHRDRYGQLLEFECSENDRNPVDANGNTEFH